MTYWLVQASSQLLGHFQNCSVISNPRCPGWPFTTKQGPLNKIEYLSFFLLPMIHLKILFSAEPLIFLLLPIFP